MIVEWHPERRERILLCTHYDTRPFPDQDRHNPRGTFLGANDGASGTALLMELAPPDGRPATASWESTSCSSTPRNSCFRKAAIPYFVGSEYFATNYATQKPPYRYRWGVLLDLVADADLQIYPDRQSMSWDDTRPLVQAIWDTAKRLGVREFVFNKRYDVLDDHLKLHNIGKIPSCDIIDFNYPVWHTQAGHARALLGLVAGQSRLGRARMAPAGRAQIAAHRPLRGARRNHHGYLFRLRGLGAAGDLSACCWARSTSAAGRWW